MQQMAEIRIRGAVQGVGFRPCVWQLARAMALRGEVRNDGAGVLIRLFPASAADDFLTRLQQALPPLASIDSAELRLGRCHCPPEEFRIAPSGGGPVRTPVLPDIATCPACRAEIRDPGARRQGYAFTNCTHCGPRYSIIRRLPYDRAATAMAPFSLCPDCLRDYGDPADRRFHAQPIACPRCGPRLWLAGPDGERLQEGEPIAAAARRLARGELLAIKALGGFHLACDARDESAIARLRRWKQRPDKPLAVMVADLDALEGVALATVEERALLDSPAAPIVLLRRQAGGLPASLTPGLDRLGVMLPANPLQHLLLAAVARPLVMTSGNVSGAPPCLGNDEALARLGPGVEALLLHDRDILYRVDDSLAQQGVRGPQLLRRGRGYAPAPLRLGPGLEQADGLLALGGDLKCAPCLLREGQAFLAPHQGDLAHPENLAQLRQTLERFGALLDCPPRALACDGHPGYHSRRLALASPLPVQAVPHHHAHLAACLADNGQPLSAPPVLGLILDGSGMAPAGSAHPIWGGEILYGDYRHCRRLDGLPAVALPGGEQAAREPWRNLLAQLDAWQPDWPRLALPALQALLQRPVAPLRRLIASGLNSPRASSCGRLFDAVAALLEVAPARQGYEGQAAMALEALAGRARERVSACFSAGDSLALAPLWRQLLDALTHQVPAAEVAWLFHRRLADLLVARLVRLGGELDCHTVAMSGGCLQNRLLQALLHQGLQEAGFEVLLHSRVPASDGGLALGQAVVGWLSWQEGGE